MDSFTRQILTCQSPPVMDNLQDQRHLSQEMASFIQLCENSDARRRQIIQELQDAAAEVNRLKEKMLKYFFLCILCLILAVVAKPGVATAGFFTVCLIFLLVAVCALVGFVYAVIFILRISSEIWRHSRTMTILTENFKVTVKPLNNSLEGVKSACGRLRRTSDGRERLKLIRLEINILELFFITETLPTAQSPNTITEEEARKYSKTADEFVRMKKDLQTFY